MLHQFFTFSPNVLTMVNCPSIIFHSKGELLFWSYKLKFFTYSYVNVRPSIVKTPKYNFGKANFDGSVISIVYQIPFSNYFPTLSFRTSKPLYNSPFCNKKVKKLKGHFWQGTHSTSGPLIGHRDKAVPGKWISHDLSNPGNPFSMLLYTCLLQPTWMSTRVPSCPSTLEQLNVAFVPDPATSRRLPAHRCRLSAALSAGFCRLRRRLFLQHRAIFFGEVKARPVLWAFSKNMGQV